MNKPNKSVTDKLAALLLRGRSITTLQALEKWGCLRIPNRVCDLRKEGWRIDSIRRRINGKTVTAFKLAKP